MNWDGWKHYLSFKSVDSLRDYLSTGIEHGFAIVDRDVDIQPYRCSNYSLILRGDAFDFVNDLILGEIAAGKYLRADITPHCVHALGAVVKSDGTYRPIIDCKRPIGRSINNFMDETFQQFNYRTVDQVAGNMTTGCYMASVDISAAY